MSTSEKRATPDFVADFALVSRYYKCSESEIDEMKACARKDMANAAISFGFMAREISEGAA